MRRELIIDESLGQTRAAVIEEGELREVFCERQTGSAQAENIYYGRVQAIRPSVHAAFVDIGEELHAFLPLEEGMKLRCGDMLIVQGLARQTTDSKGLRITTKVNLAGKWLVLLPGGSGVHVSKKIKNPQLRDALSEIGSRMVKEGYGLIIRTAGEDVTAELLEEEAAALYERWHAVAARAAGMTVPGLLQETESRAMRLARDLNRLDRIVINNEEGYQKLITAQKNQRISEKTQIECFKEKSQLIFDAFGIEPQIDKALKKRVWLPCGGYLIIDPCEAMTVIDVNSGKMILGRDLEDTALKVNLEAAQEIARQLRLRDIGGIIVVDFIDMKKPEHRQTLLGEMARLAKQDRSQVSIEGMTRLGLIEITRKRVQAPLRKQLRVNCSYCGGSAEVFSPEETARRSLRQVRRMLLAGQRGPFVIRCAQQAAQTLLDMHVSFMGADVYILAVSGKHAERFEIEQLGTGVPLPKEARKLQYEE